MMVIRSACPKVRASWSLVVIACVVAGCGSDHPETGYAEGVVTLDGDPVEGATVILSPDAGGRPAVGTTRTDGTFTLSTFPQSPGDGALLGSHGVSISKVARGGPEGEFGPGGMPLPGNPTPFQQLLPVHYGNASTSGLSATIHSGTNHLAFELTTHSR